jgi:hypothetical protein
MSVLDPSSLLQLTAPELLAPPDPPVTPAIDTSTTSTADSTSSGSSSDASDSFSLGTTPTAQETADAELVGANVSAPPVNQYQTAAVEAAAALVDIGGASSITVGEYQSSIPPNMAAASALLDELTQNSNNNSGLLSAAYLALSSDDTLSLTSA